MDDFTKGFVIIANLSALIIVILWYLEKNNKIKIPLLYKSCLDVNPVLGMAMHYAVFYAVICFSIIATELLFAFVALCKLIGNIL